MEGNDRDLLGTWGVAYSAAWAIDGRRVLFTGRTNDVPEGIRKDLWSIDLIGGTPECRTGDNIFGVGGALHVDMPPMWFNLERPRISSTRTARLHSFTHKLGGRMAWCELRWSALHIRPSFSMAIEVASESNSAETRCCAWRAHLHSPPDLLIANVRNSSERRLTNVNQMQLE